MHFIYQVELPYDIYVELRPWHNGIALFYQNETTPINTYHNDYQPFKCMFRPGEHSVIVTKFVELISKLAAIAKQTSSELTEEDKKQYEDDIILVKELSQFLHPDKISWILLFLPSSIGGLGLYVLAPKAVLAALAAVGFTSEGVKLGSIAAAVQWPAVPSTSWFALLQSIGAKGLVPTIVSTSGLVVGLVALAGITAAIHKMLKYDDTCWDCCYNVSCQNPPSRVVQRFLETSLNGDHLVNNTNENTKNKGKAGNIQLFSATNFAVKTKSKL